MGGFNAEPTDTTFSDFCERMIFDLVKDETCFKIPNFGNWRKWLDIIFGYKISRENNKFVTSIYRKPIFSGVFTNFESFIPDMRKGALIETLLHRGFRLCSS